MKKLFIALCITTSLFAVDYSTFTNDELFDARGTVSTEDKTAFQDEMKTRMQTLTPEERSVLRGTGTKASSGTGNGTMKRLKDGSGAGNKYQYKGSRSGGHK
jgi:hypothetical protein